MGKVHCTCTCIQQVGLLKVSLKITDKITEIYRVDSLFHHVCGKTGLLCQRLLQAFSRQESHEGVYDLVGQLPTHLGPHAVKERVEEAHDRGEDVGVVEEGGEERDGEVEVRGESREEHLL